MAVQLISDIRDYPWGSLFTGILPARFQPKKASQIVPSASIAGNALTVVIAIMTFLACLTAGAVYMVNQSAEAWVKDISSEITVELDPVNAPDIDKKVTLVSLFLAKQTALHDGEAVAGRGRAKVPRALLGPQRCAVCPPHPALDGGRERSFHPAGQQGHQRGVVAELRGRDARRSPPMARRDSHLDQ